MSTNEKAITKQQLLALRAALAFPTPNPRQAALIPGRKTPDRQKDPQRCGQQNLKQKQLDEHLHWLAQPNHHLICLSDASYPALLKEIADPPPCLFCIGQIDLLKTPQLAIVGSRNPTHAGKTIAHQFATDLSDQGLTITSGLALGIDTQAHCAALAHPFGCTVAVLGCGVDVIYPKSNRHVYEQICDKGCIISEFPLKSPPRRQHFPRRNRIITGLSLGTLVVEARCKSGSLISARMALEQNREVFAIPGSIFNPQARGCHQLISQGAKLVENYADIIVELPTNTVKGCRNRPIDPGHFKQKANRNKGSGLDETLFLLLQCIDCDTLSFEQIQFRSGLAVQKLKHALLELELLGHIKSELGQYFRV
jgi:DNA processing protein